MRSQHPEQRLANVRWLPTTMSWPPVVRRPTDELQATVDPAPAAGVEPARGVLDAASNRRGPARMRMPIAGRSRLHTAGVLKPYRRRRSRAVSSAASGSSRPWDRVDSGSSSSPGTPLCGEAVASQGPSARDAGDTRGQKAVRPRGCGPPRDSTIPTSSRSMRLAASVRSHTSPPRIVRVPRWLSWLARQGSARAGARRGRARRHARAGSRTCTERGVLHRNLKPSNILLQCG